MTISVKKDYNFDDLMENSWSGAIYTLNTVREHDKEEELMNLIVECFSSIPSDTEVNDLLWFDDEWIFEQLGISADSDSDDE